MKRLGVWEFGGVLDDARNGKKKKSANLRNAGQKYGRGEPEHKGAEGTFSDKATTLSTKAADDSLAHVMGPPAPGWEDVEPSAEGHDGGRRIAVAKLLRQPLRALNHGSSDANMAPAAPTTVVDAPGSDLGHVVCAPTSSSASLGGRPQVGTDQRTDPTWVCRTPLFLSGLRRNLRSTWC